MEVMLSTELEQVHLMKYIQVGNNTILEINYEHANNTNTRNLHRNETSLEDSINDSVIIILLIPRASLLCKLSKLRSF